MIKLEPAGRPPEPRCFHAAAFFGKKYLAIHGGRNDKMYKEYKNVALNDINLYDVEKNEWTVVENYGCFPEGRYGHAMVS
jgi:hypothetical protein